MSHWILTKLIQHADIIVPIFLPGMLIGLGYLFRALFGDSNLISSGPDISLNAFSIYFVTSLFQVLNGKLKAPSEIVGIMILAMFFLVSWFLCLILSYRKFPLKKLSEYQPVLSIAVAILIFWIACVLSWEILC